MRKFLIVGATLTALVVPSVASANAPDGEWAFKANAKVHTNTVATYSSQIKQNGQFVSGQDNAYDADQTTTPGSRAEGVQALLGH